MHFVPRVPFFCTRGKDYLAVVPRRKKSEFKVQKSVRKFCMRKRDDTRVLKAKGLIICEVSLSEGRTKKWAFLGVAFGTWKSFRGTGPGV